MVEVGAGGLLEPWGNNQASTVGQLDTIIPTTLVVRCTVSLIVSHYIGDLS